MTMDANMAFFFEEGKLLCMEGELKNELFAYSRSHANNLHNRKSIKKGILNLIAETTLIETQFKSELNKEAAVVFGEINYSAQLMNDRL